MLVRFRDALLPRPCGNTDVKSQIGYMIRRDSQGLGYAAEAAVAVMSECARAQLGRVKATVRPTNEASMRVLERIGMKFEPYGGRRPGSLALPLSNLRRSWPGLVPQP
ncbi:GNAT family N-acetyltransferase [Actinopolymorpha alba]|uniref:GNAT family N-acetyltransferase n=1 Tax=Actinopolymorpha alba TaxID=533267 RepID=UPI000A019128